MFEKIFGIFRKRKKADISQEIPGDTGEDMFDMGDAELGDDFEADTISLETGMSDGGFSGSSGGMADSGPEFGEPVSGVTEPPMEEGLGFDLEVEEEIPGVAPGEEPISPPPEVEAEVFAPPKRRRGVKGIIAIVGVAIIGLVAGFFLTTSASVEMFKRLVSSEPTLLEQLEQLNDDNGKLNDQLKVYRSVGTIEEILAVKEEVRKRKEMSAEIEAIENRIADRPAVEDRLDRVSARLQETERNLAIQKGTLANVQKALKQIEARNNYLIASTRKRLDQIEEARVKSEMLKSRLEPERVNRAEADAFLSRGVQEGVERTAFEALSSL